MACSRSCCGPLGTRAARGRLRRLRTSSRSRSRELWPTRSQESRGNAANTQEGAMLREFVEFLTKTNALALAVAVIMGAAIGKVVSSVVADLLMPVVGLFVGGGEWRAWSIPLKTAPDGKVLTGIRRSATTEDTTLPM